MTTKNLTYTRPDGVQGVGYFIPFAGKYVHSVAWPDQQAERYTVDRLVRMEIGVEGMETIGKAERDYLASEHGWRFLDEEEAAEVKAALAEQLGVELDVMAVGPEVPAPESNQNVETWITEAARVGASDKQYEAFAESMGVNVEYLRSRVAELSKPSTEVPSDETSKETGGEAVSTEDAQAISTDAPVVPVDDAEPSDNATTETTVDGPSGDSTELADASDATDEAEGDSTESEGEDTTEDAPVSEAQAIRDYLAEHPNAPNKVVVAALKKKGFDVTSGQVSREKRR